MKHLELFAGIGGFRQAMRLIQKDFSLSFSCVGASEIDKNAIKTYRANYHYDEDEIDMGDISTFVRSDQVHNLPFFDILTGGFPCQAFSMMGKQKGFDDARGIMFFEIERLLQIQKEKNIMPPFLLLENVKNLRTHDGGRTFNTIISHLSELGYHVYSDVFNTADFGLAQTRNRILIFATTIGLPLSFQFNAQLVKDNFWKNISDMKSIHIQRDVLDVLSKEVDPKYFLSERLKPTILADGSKNFKSKSEINQFIARPLTATMHKMHRACQDNYYSQGFIDAENPREYSEIVFSKEELAKQPIRKLTPFEAFMLQGFDYEFCQNGMNAGVCNGALYKQAGNAVSVNVIYAVLHYLFINHNIQQYANI